MEQAADEQLLRAWQAGDRRAGAELFDRHFAAVHRFFTHKAGEAVEDLVQRTFTEALAGAARFAGRSSFRTFLFGVARNVLLESWRKRRRDLRLDPSISSLHDLDPSPSSLAARRQEQRLLLEALRRLPLDLQLAVELHYWEGLSGPELASVLDVPEGTVRSRLRRAKEQLQQLVTELAGDPALAASTLDGFEGWAAEVRAQGEADSRTSSR